MNVVVKDILICGILIGIIYFGTKFVNYYHNFYHIYSFLDNEQKFSYFKNTFIVNLISKNKFIKKFTIFYLLIPIVKLNYLFIQLFITLLYSLCHNEFNKVIQNHIQQEKNNKLKNSVINNLIQVDFSENYLSESKSNENDELEKNDELENNLHIDSKVKINDINLNSNLNLDKVQEVSDCDLNNIKNDYENNLNINNINDIKNDYENNMTNIIDFISDINKSNSKINLMNDINEINNINEINDTSENYIDIDRYQNLINNSNQIINSHNYKSKSLNLLNELDLLKSFKDSKTEIIEKNKEKKIEYTENNLDNELTDYLVIEELNLNNNNNIEKIKKKYSDIETINIDDIDFSVRNIEDLILQPLTKSENLDIKENKNKENIIKIGKKKKI